MARTCSICDRPHHARGLCQPHYFEAWREDALPPVQEKTVSLCEVEGCDRPSHAKGLCTNCYRKVMRATALASRPAPQPRPVRSCSVEGCADKHYAKGLCARHWQRSRRHEKPKTAPKVIRTCSVEGCEKPHDSKGLCRSHYNKSRYTPKEKQPRPVRTCSIEGCEEKHRSKGLCHNHYEASRRAERPATTKRAPRKPRKAPVRPYKYGPVPGPRFCVSEGCERPIREVVGKGGRSDLCEWHSRLTPHVLEPLPEQAPIEAAHFLELLTPADHPLSDSEIEERFGEMLHAAIDAFRSEPEYVVTMAERAAHSKIYREKQRNWYRSAKERADTDK